MTNKEYYSMTLEDIDNDGYRVAIINNKPVPCKDTILCNTCKRKQKNGQDCLNTNARCSDLILYNWLEAEHLSDKAVDWSKITVDTKVMVSHDGVNWRKAYFSRYENNKVFVFNAGRTSWNKLDCNSEIFYEYVKLVEELKNKKQNAELNLPLELLQNDKLLATIVTMYCPQDFGYEKKSDLICRSDNCYSCWVTSTSTL